MKRRMASSPPHLFPNQFLHGVGFGLSPRFPHHLAYEEIKGVIPAVFLYSSAGPGLSASTSSTNFSISPLSLTISNPWAFMMDSGISPVYENVVEDFLGDVLVDFSAVENLRQLGEVFGSHLQIAISFSSSPPSSRRI
jgi:hypothetical protein